MHKYICMDDECNFSSKNEGEAHNHNSDHLDHVMAEVEEYEGEVSAKRFGEDSAILEE